MRVVIWGTGKGAEGVQEILRDIGAEVTAYIDNDTMKHGTCYNGKPVVGPDRLLDCTFDYVVIASAYYEAILRQITSTTALAQDKIIIAHDNPAPLFNTLKQQTIPYKYMRWDHLQAPILNHCNLDCRHCTRTDSNRDLYNISVENYRRILSSFDPDKFRELHISADGEITLVRDYRDYYDVIRDLGWKSVFFVTNGTCLDEEYYDYIFESGMVSKLIISIESVVPEHFKSIRGYSFDRFMKFLKLINKYRDKHNARTMFCFSATSMRGNLHELPDIVDFAAVQGIEHVHFFPLKTVFAEGEVPGKLCVPSEAMDRVPHHERQQVYEKTIEASLRTSVNVVLPERTQAAVLATTEFSPNTLHSVCTLPLKHVVVDQKGAIRPCCQMSFVYSMGNVFEATFEEIWNGDTYHALLDSLKVGNELLPCCDYCTVPKGYCW